MARTQKRRQNGNGRQAEPAWLIADQDRDGQQWYSVRLFLGECGPIYFGSFQDTRQADAFYAQAQRYLGGAGCDLTNLANTGSI